MTIPVLGGLGDLLNWYQYNVGDNVSGSVLKLAAGVGNTMAGGNDPGLSQYANLDAHQALNTAYQDNPLGRFAFTTLTDPINLVGVGLPEHLAGNALLHGIPVLGRALDAASVLDKAPGVLGDKGLDVLGNAAKMAYPAIAHLDPAFAAFADKFPGLAEGWQGANRAYKEVSHLIPGYVLGNFVDDSSRAGAQGFGGAMTNAAKGLAGLETNAGDQFLKDFGGNVSEAVADTGVPGGSSVFRKFPYEIGGVDTSGLKSAVFDPLSRWSEWNKGLEQRLDQANRGALWGQAAQSSMDEAAPGFASYLADTYGPSHGLTTAFADAGGKLDQVDLMDAALKNGVAPNQASQLGESWQNAISGARDYADEQVNHVLLNYGGHPDEQIAHALQQYGVDPAAMLSKYGGGLRDITPAMVGAETGGDTMAMKAVQQAQTSSIAEGVLSSLAKNTFGGYRFATQAVPASLRLGFEHPVIANAPAQWYHDADQYDFMHGLNPSSYRGQMPFDVAGNRVMINPLGLSSIGELFGEMTPETVNGMRVRTDGGDYGPLGEAARDAGDMSLGLNPILRTALTLTGQNGNTQLQDMVRPLAPVNALAGLIAGQPVDLEQPVKNVVAGAEQALTGRVTFPFQTELVRRMQADVSGGTDPLAPTYTSGPVHDAANRAVANQLAIKDLADAGLRLPMSIVDPAAQRIGQNQALANFGSMAGNPSPSLTNPTRNAYDLVDPRQEIVMNWAHLPPAERARLLLDPTIGPMITQIQSGQMHAAVAPGLR
jgi:hypothetical protein